MNSLYTPFSISIFVGLLAACDQPSNVSVDAVKDSPTPSTDVEEVDGPTEAPPTPTLQTTGKARTTEGVAGQQKTDAFTFWGWSEDGSKYAFEVVYSGAGGATCEGRFQLFVVDAQTDKFDAKGVLTVEHDEHEPSNGECTPTDLSAVMDEKRPGHLETHNITVGNIVAPSSYTPQERNRWSVETPTGTAITIAFSVVGGGRERVMESGQGAAYRLRYIDSFGKWNSIESGKHHRQIVWDYDVSSAPVFFSPNGTHVAFFLQRSELDFEGNRITWMSNGAPLPSSLF